MFHNQTRTNVVELIDLNVTGNEANGQIGSGGGLVGDVVTDTEASQNQVLCTNITMRYNKATWGGRAMVIYGNCTASFLPYYSYGPNIQFVKSVWEENMANCAGAAVAAFHFIPIDSIAVTCITFSDCTFKANRIPRVQGKTKRSVYGTFFSLRAPLYFNGSTLITGNNGSALIVSATKVHFAGNIEFAYNQLGICWLCIVSH